MTEYSLVVTRAQEYKSTRKEIKDVFVILMCVFAVLGYGYFKLYESRPTTQCGAKRSLPEGDESRPTLGISLIQGNIPQELKWTPGAEGFILDRYLGLSQEAAKDRPDLIIWPEASVPGFLGEDEWVFKSIFEKAKSIGIPILAGTVVREDEKYYNSALLIDKQGEIAARYDKLHLVPFGEYIPLKNTFRFLETIVPIGDFTPGREHVLFSLPMSFPRKPAALLASRRSPSGEAAGSRGPLGRRESSRLDSPVKPGNDRVRPSTGQLKFAALICFEDTIPEISRGFVNRGADFLVNITNDGWFGRSAAPYQHLSASVFRAVENRVPVARSANTGVSCFIDSRGRIISTVRQGNRETFVPGFKSENITIGNSASFYCRAGDIFVFACLAIIIFCGIIGNLKIARSFPRKPAALLASRRSRGPLGRRESS